MKTLPILALVATLGLGACSDKAPEPAPSDGATVSLPVESAAATESAPAASASFPAAMLGRWGLVPADCTSQRGDNKGMITITADEIRFYESVATIAAIKETTPTQFRAALAFEGEGMQWSREALLEAKPAADQLVMEEFGTDAVPGPRTYTRCK